MWCASNIPDVFFAHTLVLSGKPYAVREDESGETKYGVCFRIRQSDIANFNLQHSQYGTFWIGISFLDIKTHSLPNTHNTLAVSTDSVKDVNRGILGSHGIVFFCCRKDVDENGFAGTQGGTERMRPVTQGILDDLEFVVTDLDEKAVIVGRSFRSAECKLGVLLLRSRRMLGE